MGITGAEARIRPGRPSDAAALARVQCAAALDGFAHIFPADAPKPTVESLTPSWHDLLVDPEVTVLVAEDATEPADATGPADAIGDEDRPVVGGVVVRPEPSVPAGFLFERLYVDPSCWATGIGGRLHDEAIRAAEQRGVRRVNLWVLVENRRGRAMYEQRRWRLVTGERLALLRPPVSEVLYELELDENKEGPAGGSRSLTSREAMLGGTRSTSTTHSVSGGALSDNRAEGPIRRPAVSLDDIVEQAITDARARFAIDGTDRTDRTDSTDANDADTDRDSDDANANDTDTGDTDIVVLEARDVTWRDSSLGCPAPGMSYLQRLTEGFLVVLRVGVRRVEYHSGPSGPARYCPNPRPPLPAGTPGFGPV